MRHTLRTLAMDRSIYDRVTTICLVLVVGAVIVDEPDSHLRWLSYAVAGMAAITAATLYFYRLFSGRSPQPREPGVQQLVAYRMTSLFPRPLAEEVFGTLSANYLRAAGSMRLHDAILRDLELVRYSTIEYQQAIKSIERAKKSLRYSYNNLSPLLDSHFPDCHGARDSHSSNLAAYAWWIDERRTVSRSVILKPKIPIPKHRASDSPLWMDHFISGASGQRRFLEGISQ